jgi:8-amino-7-oxononanoate synthase
MSHPFFEQQLSSLQEQGLLRELFTVPKTEADGSDNGILLNFSTNDYLGLANDPRLKQAAVKAVNKFGTGSMASRLLAGNLQITEELEENLAQLTGTESALVFGSGFLTNLGIFSAITEAGDVIFSDWLNHASIIDGIRLSRAHHTRYRHKDLDHLESLLRSSPDSGKRIIVSESLFSMDGDIAPVKSLVELAERYGALLIIDEAHAIGVMGNGGGVCRTLPEVHPDIIIGTLSKALGGYGGFVASSEIIRRFLINKARSFIYSTGLPPSCIGSAATAAAIVKSHPEMGINLLEKTKLFYDILTENGFRLPPFESQIIQIPIGNNEKAVRFSELLVKRRLFIRAIRPPTVPTGTSRIRLSITLSMTDEALEKAAQTLAESAREAGIIA